MPGRGTQCGHNRAASEFREADLETAAFTIFLHPRGLGCAAAIDDHLNRGRNMDARTPASQCTSALLSSGAHRTQHDAPPIQPVYDAKSAHQGDGLK
ncbi:hypothetical protein [Paraburkholderia sp. A3RO-2L]|uniref:hypothetical protein n=1 Tax=Paraburkholderia sp. A3RO-2L TaxID=3028376 RepID=UPI003DA9728F